MAERKPSNKEIRELMAAIELGGWDVTPPAGKSNIWKARCWCGEHIEHIHSTPSGPYYARNKLGHMKKTCWREG